jgi:superfamily II DNA or RNA helicase
MTALRDYQNNAVERLEQTTKALYVLPTGGGKTVVATNLIERAARRSERVLVLTHRREILRQTSLGLPIDHGLSRPGSWSSSITRYRSARFQHYGRAACAPTRYRCLPPI